MLSVDGFIRQENWDYARGGEQGIGYRSTPLYKTLPWCVVINDQASSGQQYVADLDEYALPGETDESYEALLDLQKIYAYNRAAAKAKRRREKIAYERSVRRKKWRGEASCAIRLANHLCASFKKTEKAMDTVAMVDEKVRKHQIKEAGWNAVRDSLRWHQRVSDAQEQARIDREIDLWT